VQCQRREEQLTAGQVPLRVGPQRGQLPALAIPKPAVVRVVPAEGGFRLVQAAAEGVDFRLAGAQGALGLGLGAYGRGDLLLGRRHLPPRCQ
jgi:hypothetical protein